MLITETLFREIIMTTVTEVSEPFQALIREVGEADNVPGAIRDLARKYIAVVMAPEVLRPRQLFVREAGRLPDLARAYHEGAPGRTIRQLSETFAPLVERDELTAKDPEVAAGHFAFLLLGRPLDAVMFGGRETNRSARELADIADAATDVFLAACRPQERHGDPTPDVPVQGWRGLQGTGLSVRPGPAAHDRLDE